MNELSISAIIPTKNRPDELARAVESILRGTLVPGEIIVIDQSTNDLSRNAVDQLFRNAPESLRSAVELVYVQDPAISGLTAARNRSMEIAHGDVWLFIDDDMVAEPEFLENLVEAYSHHPEAAGISGIITNYSPPDLFYRRWSAIFARGPFHDERQPVYWAAERLRDAKPIKVRMLGGGMMSFRADAIRGIRFDPNLTGVSLAEDSDFTLRLSEAGAELYIAPSARIEHRHSVVGRATDHWLRAHAQASYYLYYRHWRKGIANRTYFAWLRAGYTIAIALACLKRRSPQPLWSFRAGVRNARAITSGRATQPC